MSTLADQVSARLRAVMAVCDIRGNKAFAELCEATPSAVNDCLLGYNLLKAPEMSLLCEKTGVTLDWLYRGSMAAMDPKLRIKLDAPVRPRDY